MSRGRPRPTLGLLRAYAHVYDSQHAEAVEREEAYLTADRDG